MTDQRYHPKDTQVNVTSGYKSRYDQVAKRLYDKDIIIIIIYYYYHYYLVEN